MAKLKRTVAGLLLFLLAVCFCIPLVACGDESAVTENVTDTKSPCGLYTKLTYTVDSGNGSVWATAENRLTILPATVIVELELYRSETYKESVTEMSLADSNYSADLDQGETLTVTASTNGKESYWKVKMRYKIDRDKWEEQISETMLFGADGTRKEITSKPVADDREYFISDFLQYDAKLVAVGIYPYNPNKHNPQYGFVSTAYAGLDSADEINAVKELFGDIKLNPFDVENKTYEEQQEFYFTNNLAPYMLYTELSDGSTAVICVNDRNGAGENVFVRYYNRKTENGFNKCFTATVSAETKQALIDWASKKYESENNINASATEWIKLADLMQGDVKTARIDMRLSLPYYDKNQVLVAEKRIVFNIDNEELLSVKDILGGTEVAPFDKTMIWNGIEAGGLFDSACKYCSYSLTLTFDNGNTFEFCYGSGYEELYINSFVTCTDGDTGRYFTGYISVEAMNALSELTKNIYKD